jgi:hypothetical protein
MKIKLKVHELWDTVDPGDVEFQVDQMTLDVISSTMAPEMVICQGTNTETEHEQIKTGIVRAPPLNVALGALKLDPYAWGKWGEGGPFGSG